MRVRHAVAADVRDMSALAGRAFIDAYGASSDPDDLARHVEQYFGRAAIEREIERPGVQYFVADDGGTLAGLLKLRDGELPEAIPASTALEVQQLYVDTIVQRGGIGGRLIRRAVQAAGDAGVGGIWLSVWTEADWATSFYRKCGFEPLGELDFYLGRTHYVDYLMWLAIDATR